MAYLEGRGRRKEAKQRRREIANGGGTVDSGGRVEENGRQLVDRFIILERYSRTTCKVCRTDSGHPAERNNHITHERGAFASHPLDTVLARHRES